MAIGTTLIIREAREADLPALIAMFAADPLGGHGDTTDAEAYPDYAGAFADDRGVFQSDALCRRTGGDVVGTFQTMITTSLTGRGASVDDHRGGADAR